MSIKWKLFFLGLILSISSVNSAEGKCKVCDSTESKCATEPESLTDVDCVADSCFTAISNDGKIKRGCVDDTNKCDNTNNCVKCTGTGCNTVKITFTCKNCDSSTDPNCAQWTDGNAIVNQICGSGITKCLMQIKDDKNIERRCVTKNDEACPAGKMCKICDSTGCNKDIYPADRRRCYQCDSSSKCANPQANTAEILSLPCTLYDEAEKCFVYGTSETDMARGCASNTSAITKCTDAKEKCVQCTTDNCNDATFKTKQSIKCIQCAKEESNCFWGYQASAAKDCVNQIEFWQPQACYTNIVDKDKAERGCINDAPQGFDCSKVDTCTSCSSGNGCNNADGGGFTCYQCRSDADPNCAKALVGNSLGSGKCINPVSEATKGCYTERWKDIVIRSCLVDADEKTRELCNDPKYKLCVTCPDSDCNKLAPPNSARNIALGSGLLALTLLVLRFF